MVSNNGNVRHPDERFPGNCSATDREMLECCFSVEGKWPKNVGTNAFSLLSDELERFVSAA